MTLEVVIELLELLSFFRFETLRGGTGVVQTSELFPIRDSKPLQPLSIHLDQSCNGEYKFRSLMLHVCHAFNE